MSTASQFIGSTAETAVGEVVNVLVSELGTAPSINGDFIKTGAVYLKSDYPKLFDVLGYIGVSNFIPGEAITSTVYALTYGNSLYVYAGDSGALGTSTNGINWTTRTSGTTELIDSLIYNNNLYVYAGSGGALATSTDAINWTARTSGTSSYIITLTYGNGVYVYAGVNGVMGSSTDAINWTSRTSGTSSTINALTYGNGLYVYAGNGGVVGSSTDAINWTVRSSGTTSTIYALTYGNGIYVYAGAAVLATSTNAVNWTSRNDVAVGSTALEITYENSLYVYVGGTSGVIKSSTDSINWISNAAATTLQLRAITYGNGLWVTAGNIGYIHYSTDISQVLYSPSYNISTEFYVPTYVKSGNPTIASNTAVQVQTLFQSYIRAK